MLQDQIRSNFLSIGAGVRCREEIHWGIASGTGKKRIDGQKKLISYLIHRVCTYHHTRVITGTHTIPYLEIP